MTAPGVFLGFGPLLTPVTVEARVEIDQLDTDAPLGSLWFKYSAHEMQGLRTYLAGEVGNRDGAVSIWIGDDTELIVPSRTIRWLTITTRPLTPEGGISDHTE